MGVNDPDAVAQVHVLKEHVPEECGLPDPVCANDVDMVPAVGSRNPKRAWSSSPFFTFT